MNWEVIILIVVFGLIIFFKQFGQDIIENTKWHEHNRKKGQKRWEWATTRPYFTFKKVLYWLLLLVVLGIYIYLGFKLESVM